MITLPRKWAGNATFVGGAHAGEPTKVDPGSAIAGNGLYPDLGFAAEHANHELNALSVSGRALFARAALRLRPLTIIGDAIDDTGSMAATQVNGTVQPSASVVVVKAGSEDVYTAALDDAALIGTGGTVSSITSDAVDAATNGTRIVVIGIGGNLNSYSDNSGGSWSAGAAGIGGAVEYLVYAPANGLTGGGDCFFCAGSGTGSIYQSPNAATVWDAAASSFAAVQGLAVLGGATANAGYVVSLGASGSEPRFSVLTDGGAGGDFSGTQQPPNASLADEPGSIASAPRVSDRIWHIMRSGSGARLRLAYTTDGTNWTTGETATIERPFGADFEFAGPPRLMIDPFTGLMVIAVQVTAGPFALYASLDGIDWTDPLFVHSSDASQFAVAGGRLFLTLGDQMFASDGIVS